MTDEASGGHDTDRRIPMSEAQRASLSPTASIAFDQAIIAVDAAQSPRDVAQAVIGMVRAVGGSIDPVGIAPVDALPWNLTFGVDEAMLASADPGSLAARDLTIVLPELLHKARSNVISLRQRALRMDPAMRDPLTGLINRTAFDSQLARLEPGDAVALTRLNHLDLLTMNVGAAGTDNVLTTFATLLTDHLRPTDVAARYTDEIFAVALAGISAAALARRLEMIRQAWNGVRAYTISVSVAIAPILSTPDDALLRATRELAEDAGTPQGFRTSHH